MEYAFDSHAHLNDPKFDADREEVFASLRDAGVGYVLNIGCCRASSFDCVALAEKYPFVWAAVGSHPDDAGNFCEEYLETYRGLAKNPRVRAIGEIGLDYYYDTVPRETQRACFRAQMALAQELDLPVVVHERDAHGDGMDIIREFPQVRGVFHCYSGSPEMAKELIRRGWYVGFTGVLTFKNARKAVETAAAVPLERILIETDCPFMAPEPHRGTRCDSRMVPLVAARLAEIRGISTDDALRITRENAMRLFRIENR